MILPLGSCYVDTIHASSPFFLPLYFCENEDRILSGCRMDRNISSLSPTLCEPETYVKHAKCGSQINLLLYVEAMRYKQKTTTSLNILYLMQKYYPLLSCEAVRS